MSADVSKMSETVVQLKTKVDSVVQENMRIEEESHVMRLDIDAAGGQVDRCGDRVEMLEVTVAHLTNELDRLEGYSRRENVRFYGIAEGKNMHEETADVCMRKMLALLQEVIPSRDWKRRDIVKAHRIGMKPTELGSSRVMIVKFLYPEDKDLVFASRAVFKDDHYVRLSADLTKRQFVALNNAREDGTKIAFYQGGKIVVRNYATPMVTDDDGNATGESSVGEASASASNQTDTGVEKDSIGSGPRRTGTSTQPTHSLTYSAITSSTSNKGGNFSRRPSSRQRETRATISRRGPGRGGSQPTK